MNTNLSQIARTAAQHGDWPRVNQIASHIIEQESSNPEGYFLMGLFEKANSRPLKAIEYFGSALEKDAKRYDAAIEMADQLTIAQRNSEAADLIKEYASYLDNSPRYLDLSGTILTDIGLPEEALPFYLKANELQPDIDLFQGNLAACYSYLGKIEESEIIYQTLLKKKPNHQRNHYRLSRLKKAKDRVHVDMMEEVLKNSNLPPERNIYLYYAIAKELEDLGEWDNSFQYYKLAGDAATKVSRYSIVDDIEIIERIKEVCTKEWMNSDKIERKPSNKTPIFIVGLPRTGTTLTERILASHSKVQSLGETQFIPMAIRKASHVKTSLQISPEIIAEAARADIQSIRTTYEESISYRLESKDYYIEKLPYNFLFLGFIAKAFPEAKIIYLNRNPIDACFSIYKQPFTWAYKYSYDLKNLGNYYLKHQELLEHWVDTLGERLIEINYEELVTNPTESIQHLLQVIDLDEEESCFEFYKNKSASTTASASQVRQKIYSTSVNRWHEYKKHLQPIIGIFDENQIRYN